MASPHRILLADDDAVVRAGVADLLADLALEVVHAESGFEAIELVKAQMVHAAVLDWNMPGLNGLEALPVLRQTVANLPCIVYSGRWSTGLERMALDAGAFSVLQKPVVPDLMRTEIRRALKLSTGLEWGPEMRN